MLVFVLYCNLLVIVFGWVVDDVDVVWYIFLFVDYWVLMVVFGEVVDVE